MYLFRPVRGLKCRDEQNRLWQLDRSVFSNRLQFNDEDGVVQSLSYNDFHKRWLAGRWKVDPSGPALELPGFYEVNRPTLADYPPAQQAKIEYRFKVIEDLLPREAWTYKELAAHCKKFPGPTNQKAPSVRSVRRWLAAYRQRRDVTALADQSQARRSSIDGALLGILEEAIETTLLTRNRKKKIDAYDEVVALIENKNRGVGDESLRVRIPSRAAVYRVLREIDNYAADKRRLGSAEANNRNRTALATLRPKRNLERVELDHMLLDIILVDDRTGLALGRPWLTVAIDCNSRLIVGLHLSFDSPCANSVLQCIKSGILPKDQVLARFPDISAPWPAYGIWHKLVLDNGKEMHSDRLKRAALELGICLAYCPSRKPWYKGHVERFNRTVNDGLIHSLPGTTFSNPIHRAGYPSKAMACLGFRTFEKILYRWILEEYHRRPHRSLRCSPLERWTHCEEISAHILPAVPAELDLLMANVKSKPVFHYGIDLESIRYNSAALQDVARRLKPFVDGKVKAPKMDVRFHDHTVDYVDVLDPTTSTYVRVASVDPEYTTDLDRVSHRALQRRTICDKGTSWTYADRRDVRRKTEKDVEENEAHTRHQRRMAKKRAEKGTSRPDSRDTPEAARPAADTATVDSVPEYMRETYDDGELPNLDEEADATRDASVQHGR